MCPKNRGHKKKSVNDMAMPMIYASKMPQNLGYQTNELANLLSRNHPQTFGPSNFFGPSQEMVHLTAGARPVWNWPKEAEMQRSVTVAATGSGQGERPLFDPE